MNLYFRLLWLFFKIKRNKARQSLLETVDIDFRAWPLDCDINLHLTNSRYLALMDIARTWMTERLGMLGAVMKRRWFPIVNATAITYIRDIKPWQTFTVSTRLVGWDHKYFYIEQKFTSNRGLHAIAYVRGVFRGREGVVDVADIVALTGYEGEMPILPPEIVHWKAMLEQKKATNQS
ncbi:MULTISPECIES: thioesterase family protein [unclassified Pseudoalteromonas]|uniref:thioesterase family protein n=1 Tax=unclassified Pseudoalteromonas TaxID=194690 RepID=UPI000CF626B3|nr:MULTISPECIES: thioesterase family protein [unclassified Pseudoalteromonas]MBS3796211.1 thioesterase family protein [Pseudoalteromonas sp. BDTF-M6]